MSARAKLTRLPAPSEANSELPYGPKRQLYSLRIGRAQYQQPDPVVTQTWIDNEDGTRLGRWEDGAMFRYMPDLWR